MKKNTFDTGGKEMKKLIAALVFTAITFSAGLYAYVPENSEENSFEARVITPFLDVTDLINDGIKAIRQEVVSSTYDTKRTTSLAGGGVAEGESGVEEVTSKEILYYEPKEDIYEAVEVMDEILIWLTMYRTTDGEDVVAYGKLKKYVSDKKKLLDTMIKALKFEKDNKDSVLSAKTKIKKLDSDFKRYLKQLKGKIELIEGKPLPEPKD